MSKRLILGSLVIAGLTAVALWSQSPVAAFSSRPPVATQAQKPVERKPSDGPRVVGAGQTVVREVQVIDNGVARTVNEVIEVKDLQERYLEFHRRIAERLSPEQLLEKCDALDKERNGLSAEGEIEQIQKQLSEVKRKNPDDKGISTRLQRAIEALGSKAATGETFKSL